MEKHLLFSFFIVSLASCLDKFQSPRVDVMTADQTNTTVKSNTVTQTDKTVFPFGDSSYKLTLHIFDTTNTYDAASNNAVLTFSKQDKSQIRTFFSDSIFCMSPNIEFQDFDNDKVKDVLIFYYTGARANPSYHLYLIKNKNRELIRVAGFEELPNPDLDTKNNIITSIALSGTNHYSFYRISKGHKLINLGNAFEEDPSDSTQYERTIQKIMMKK